VQEADAQVVTGYGAIFELNAHNIKAIYNNDLQILDVEIGFS